MAIVEQVRERQQQIAEDRFDTQPIPAYRGSLTDTNQRAVVNALREPESAKRKRGKNVLPPPSRQVREFLVRAFGDPNFRILMERLANQ